MITWGYRLVIGFHHISEATKENHQIPILHRYMVQDGDLHKDHFVEQVKRIGLY